MRFATLCIGLLLAHEFASGGELESWIEAATDPEAMQEWLDVLRDRPLDLNQASCAEIAQLPLFDRETAAAVIEARALAHGFRDMADVQTRVELSSAQREMLVQFATVHRPAPHGRLRALSQSGDVARQRVQAGFGPNSRASGHVLVDRVRVQTDVSAGIQFRDETAGLTLVGGDYQVGSGTGLVFAPAYGSGNWLSPTGVVLPPHFQPVRSVSTRRRLSRFRGGAVSVHAWGARLNLLGSVQRLDGQATSDGRVCLTEQSPATTSLFRARSGQAEERLTGFLLDIERLGWTVGLAAYRSWFDPGLAATVPAEPLPTVAGDRIDVGSLSLRGQIGRVELVAEGARSDPGNSAYQAAIATRGEWLSASAYRLFVPGDYYSLHSQVWGGFGDDARNRSQTGCKLVAHWGSKLVGVHASSAATPFRTAAYPLRRSESAWEVWSEIPTSSTGYLSALIGRASREEDEPGAERDLRVHRFRVEWTFSSDFEFKIRTETKFAGLEGTSDHATGSLLFVQGRVVLWQTWCWLRVTGFDAEDNNVTMRVYEDAPAGIFTMSTLSGSGRRAAIMLKRSVGPASAAVKIASTTTYGDASPAEWEGAIQFGFGW